jgi:hypothetical protein
VRAVAAQNCGRHERRAAGGRAVTSKQEPGAWPGAIIRKYTPVKSFIIVTAVGAMACGRDGPESCDLDDWPVTDADCASAIVLAARDSSTISLDQQAVDSFLDQLRVAKSATCEARAAVASPQAGPVDDAYVTTTNDTIARAWSEGTLATGDAEIDTILSENRAFAVQGSEAQFVINFDIPIGVYALAEALAPEQVIVNIDDTNADPRDITIIEDGLFQFVIGWGDCLSGCEGTHTWAIAIEGDVAQVVEESGDEIPAALRDQACPGT